MGHPANSPAEVGRLSYYDFQGSMHSRCAGYSSIKSMNMFFGGRFSGVQVRCFNNLVHIYGVALHPSPSVEDYLIEQTLNQPTNI